GGDESLSFLVFFVRISGVHFPGIDQAFRCPDRIVAQVLGLLGRFSQHFRDRCPARDRQKNSQFHWKNLLIYIPREEGSLSAKRRGARLTDAPSRRKPQYTTSMNRAYFTDAELDFLYRVRVGRLATADMTAQPHVIPVVFATDGRKLYVPVDET